MAHPAQPGVSLPDFRNQTYLDFSTPENRAAMLAAVETVRARLGREYGLMIAGARVSAAEAGGKLISVNPSRPDEVVGIHAKATAELAERAVAKTFAGFAAWSRTPASARVVMLLKAAALLRARRLEYNAWLMFEAGKTWIEADAETCEAIDFCEYYAREMARLSGTQLVVQLPGERDEMVYLPLGLGIVIPPWNFPLAILCGMAVAALVAGNTIIIKPSSETPTIGAVFTELLLEAGFPAEAISFLPGSGGVIGDVLVSHPKTRFISFTGSRDVGLSVNELAAKTQPGQIWIKRVVAEMGGKDAIIVDAECDLDAAVEGVAVRNATSLCSSPKPESM